MSVAVSRRGSIVPVIGTAPPTFTRAAYFGDFTATRVTSAGLVVLVPTDEPRFSYDPVTLALRGLLLEETRENLINHSEIGTIAPWSNVDTTPSENVIAAPSGSNSADLLTEGTAGTAARRQAYTGTANAPQAMARFIKRGNTDWIRLVISETAVDANNVSAWFNLSTGAKGGVANAGTGSGAASDVENFGNGWYRCILRGIVGNAAAGMRHGSHSASADGSTTRVNNATRYEWGAQLENNVTDATSYIPCSVAVTNRNADELSVLELGSWFNPAESAVFVEWIPGAKASYVPFEFNNGTDANRFGAYRSTADSRIRGYHANASAIDFDSGPAQDVAAGVVGRTAVAFKSNDCAISTSGSAVTVDATVALASVTQLFLGRSVSASNNNWRLNGHLRKFSYYNTRLSNADLQTLSGGGAIFTQPTLAFDFTAEDVAAWGHSYA